MAGPAAIKLRARSRLAMWTMPGTGAWIEALLDRRIDTRDFHQPVLRACPDDSSKSDCRPAVMFIAAGPGGTASARAACARDCPCTRDVAPCASVGAGSPLAVVVVGTDVAQF